MDFINRIADYKRVLTEKAINVEVLNPSARTNLSTSNLPVYPVWFFAPKRGIPRQTNISELRQFARSAWVQMVTRAIKEAILQTEWDVVPEDEEEEPKTYEEEINYIKQFLENPNREPNQDFDYLINAVLDDILHIDAGVWFLNGPLKGNLVELLVYDGSSFLKEQDVNGFMTFFWQYSFRHPMNAPIKFLPEQIQYFQMNRRTHNPYGYAPLQAIQQVVQLLDQATRYNKDFFLNNAIPSLLIRVSGQKDGARRVKEAWLESVGGENAQIMAINSPDMQVEKMAATNRDMEWLDGQKWYMHLVFASYGLSPTETGFSDSTGSKSVQEGQERVSIRNAHKPYLNLLEKIITRNIIPRILGEADLPVGERTPIKFKYFPKDPQMENIESEGQRADIASKILTVNEVRKQRGLKPLENEFANDPFKNGFEDGMGDDDEKINESGKEDDSEDKQERGKEEEDKAKGDKVKRSIVPPTDSAVSPEPFFSKVVEPLPLSASQPYDEFFEKLLDAWGDHIRKAISTKLYKVPRVMSDEALFLKNFGDFLSMLLRGVALLPFLTLLKGVVKTTLNTGVMEAEKELDLNVKLGVDFNRLVDAETNKQLNGYLLPDGKKWVGLRGVSRVLESKVYERVRKGFDAREDSEAIINDVDELLGGLKRSRAATIVRTESNRMVNEGKLRTYKDANIGGFKEYVAFVDDRTSPLCRYLNHQVRGFDDPFTGPKGEQVFTPPAHINCRSFIRFVREKENNTRGAE